MRDTSRTDFRKGHPKNGMAFFVSLKMNLERQPYEKCKIKKEYLLHRFCKTVRLIRVFRVPHSSPALSGSLSERYLKKQSVIRT
jgi:hypothetical protein